MSRLNFKQALADKAGVDQVSRPMQIALVAVVLLAGMWFTVLKPKASGDTGAAASVAATPAAPGTKGLSSAVDKAKSAVATSKASADKTQAAATKASGDTATTAAKPSVTKATTKVAATTTSAAKATKTAAAKPAATKAATPTDPSSVLLDFLAKGKTVVLLFHGDGADDAAARKAVHRLALRDKNRTVITAYAPISEVGRYEAITTGVEILTAPTIVVIGKDHKATTLTGYVDAGVLKQTVGDVRRAQSASAR